MYSENSYFGLLLLGFEIYWGYLGCGHCYDAYCLGLGEANEHVV